MDMICLGTNWNNRNAMSAITNPQVEANRQKTTKRNIRKGQGGYNMDKIKIGYAPTRRSIFSAPDAVKYRGLTAERFTERDRNYAMCSKRTVK